mgnify:CR=1 FL=1
MNSEYANQNAYDCIQIHGGSGFMMEYACQRIYRDARITSIYEGTTQLQTVAAIRYVTNGSYIATLRNYEAIPCSEDMQPLMDRVKEMANKFDACTNAVKEARIKSYLISLHAVFMKWLPYVSCHIFLSKMRQKHLNCSPSRPMYM